MGYCNLVLLFFGFLVGVESKTTVGVHKNVTTTPLHYTTTSSHLTNAFTIFNLSAYTFPTLAPPVTLSPINETFPFTPLNLSAFTFPTLAPVNWSVFEVATLPPFNWSALGLPTLPPMNLSGIPTIAPFNWSSLALPTMTPLNLTAFNFTAIASPLNFGNYSLPTIPPFNWSSIGVSPLPTLAPFNWSSLGIATLPTLAPFNWSSLALPTMTPLNLTAPHMGLELSDAIAAPLTTNFSIPTMNLTAIPTLAPFNWSSLGLPTFAPLNLSALPTLAPFNWSSLGLGTLPTMTPLNLSVLPTLAPFNWSALGLSTLPPLNFSFPTFAPLNLSVLPTLPPFNMSAFVLPTLPSANLTLPTINLTGLPTLRPITLNLTVTTQTVKPVASRISTTRKVKLADENQPSLSLVTLSSTNALSLNHTKNLQTFAAIPNMALESAMFCSTVSCNLTSEVCVKDINATESCVTRQIGTKYCADNPCDTGMSCYDNVTKHKYTCYQSLDVSEGQCLTTKCVSGQVCYQESGQSAKCIDRLEAPICDATNEEYQSCTAGCDATCENPSPTCSNTSCVAGCGCIRGYVRINGKCQLMDKCDATSTSNVTCSGAEQYTDCMPSCEKSCARSSNCTTSTTTIATTCQPGCICRTGYRRDDNGNCVHLRKCATKTTCGTNESWSKCHNCEAMCGVTTNPACDQCWSGCACVDGFSRDSTTGVCVETSTCSS